MAATPRPLFRQVCSLGALVLTTAATQLVPVTAAHADTLPADKSPATAAAVALPTWQVTGVVWGQVVVGNTVYVTGNFTKARPPKAWPGGPGEIDVAHLLAYDIRTGERVASFNPQLNAQGLAITASPDGKRLYVGGDFTTVDGKARGHVAAFDAVTGKLIEGFDPQVHGQVKALAATNDTLYVGGSFESAQGQARKRLASFQAGNAKMTDWNPRADDGYVWALLATPDGSKVIAAGAFTKISGQEASGTAAIHPTTGALLPWAMNKKIYVKGVNSAITNLSTDGKAVYGGGFVFARAANLEGTFAAEIGDGKLRWVGNCLGDTYDTKPLGGVLYVANHAHDCTVIGGFPDTSPRVRWEHVMALSTEAARPITQRDAYNFNFIGEQAPNLLQFHPDLGIGQATGQFQAAWNVDGNDDYVVVAGEFPTVDGVPQQGLTRFPRKSQTTAAPRFQTRPQRDIPAPVASAEGRVVSVRFPTAWDPDNAQLNYELVRDRGTSTESVVARNTLTTSFWNLPEGRLLDLSAPAGSHTYAVRVFDGTGQQVWSETSAPVTAQGPAALTGYAKTILEDGPLHYWRLGEDARQSSDLVGKSELVYSDGMKRGTDGAVKGDPDKGATADGTANGHAISSTSERMSDTTTMETWLRTKSTKGGRFLGFAAERKDRQGNVLISNDRHLYMTPDGRIGLRPDGSEKKIESTKTYNTGSWVHVAAVVGNEGIALYVDGEEVAADRTYRPRTTATGHWYLAGDRTGVEGRFKSSPLQGDFDETAIYGISLRGDQIARHQQTGLSGKVAPVANAAPKASFTETVEGAKITVDGTGSTDSDGRIASYQWDFGDNTPAKQDAKATHTYTKSGTYSVRLTVTDDKGTTAQTTKSVTVAVPTTATTPAGEGVLLLDNFERTVTDGWGNAETGGTWTRDAARTSYAVRSGRGSIALAPRASAGAQLAGATGTDNDMRLRISYDKAATGGGIFTQVIGRGSLSDGYGVRLWVHENGTMRVAPFRKVGRADNDLNGMVVASGLTHTAGKDYNLRVQVTGTGTTKVKAKIWASGSPEPEAWLVEGTDTTAALQKPGGIAMQTYLSGTATTPNFTWFVDDMKVSTVRP